MNDKKHPTKVHPVEPALGPLPEPDLQTDPCSAAGKQTDYYTAGTVRRLLAAERERWRKTEGYALVMHPDDPLLRSLPEGQWVILQRRVVPCGA